MLRLSGGSLLLINLVIYCKLSTVCEQAALPALLVLRCADPGRSENEETLARSASSGLFPLAEAARAAVGWGSGPRPASPLQGGRGYLSPPGTAADRMRKLRLREGAGLDSCVGSPVAVWTGQQEQLTPSRVEPRKGLPSPLGLRSSPQLRSPGMGSDSYVCLGWMPRPPMGSASAFVRDAVSWPGGSVGWNVISGTKRPQKESIWEDGGVGKWGARILPQPHQNHNRTTEWPSFRTTCNLAEYNVPVFQPRGEQRLVCCVLSLHRDAQLPPPLHPGDCSLNYVAVGTALRGLRKMGWPGRRGPRWPRRRLSCVPAPLLHPSPPTPPAHFHPPSPPPKKASSHEHYTLNLPSRPPGALLHTAQPGQAGRSARLS
ncbi:uncharacterized protein LOC123804316 [Phyllostomus hastatus]|uniref:uncharacterized protein LOC123804316 n=1 Tax=Phyllostomus hastatus TaxID=9423 RepID=UPI001E6846A8|nr:uncharacterized protein LOC123804316 [Phyllostomus hastatus]